MPEDKQKTEDKQVIWDTFSRGGEYAHNMIALRLKAYERKYGTKSAKSIYNELIKAGY